MTALDFPNSPTYGQVYAAPSGISWLWDGVKWVSGIGGYLPPMIVCNGVMTLPQGFIGFVRVENNTGAPITITLPTLPVARQSLTVKDCYGNAGTYPITITGGGPSIEGAATLVLQYNYSWAELVFTGAMWVQK